MVWTAGFCDVSRKMIAHTHTYLLYVSFFVCFFLFLNNQRLVPGCCCPFSPNRARLAMLPGAGHFVAGPVQRPGGLREFAGAQRALGAAQVLGGCRGGGLQGARRDGRAVGGPWAGLCAYGANPGICGSFCKTNGLSSFCCKNGDWQPQEESISFAYRICSEIRSIDHVCSPAILRGSRHFLDLPRCVVGLNV